MIDVVLYRINSRDFIELDERTFRNLGRLVEFFASDAGDLWDWAEVHSHHPKQLVRFSADELRAMAYESLLAPLTARLGFASQT